jgi:hypothetical protein
MAATSSPGGTSSMSTNIELFKGGTIGICQFTVWLHRKDHLFRASMCWRTCYATAGSGQGPSRTGSEDEFVIN